MSFYDPLSKDFPFTLGIEEEYQIIDPVTGELRSYISQILEEGRLILQEPLEPGNDAIGGGSRHACLPHRR